MLSQKQEKAICKNIFGEWTSRAKILFYEGKFYVIMVFAKLGLLEDFKMHLFQMSIVCHTTAT